MNRDTALRLVRKLNALADPTRGGTDAERALAREKASRLTVKFGLQNCEVRERPKQRPPRPFTAPQRGAAWSFDIATGAHSPNVKVEHYRDRSNWRIEIPL